MNFIGDFHIHSHYSRATSKELNPENLDSWARIKGVKIVGSGDFTHPGWLKELKQKLEPAEPGLFKLKDTYKNTANLSFPIPPDGQVRFILTSEISNIYKKTDKVRKVHNVIFAPDFYTVEKIQHKLSKIGNITADGRPIFGLDSRDLLELVLDVSKDNLLVPAHIWTPWFSALGDKSGFDSIKECYGDLAAYIKAVETGLSTDAPMHWMCSFLDNYTLISNSDAHSPEKLGRNANLFNTEISYYGIVEAIKTGNPKHFLGTIDLFPQEGKYHYDGHRKCGICWNPAETLKHNRICTVCGKEITIGVMNRIAQLSDRRDLTKRKNRLPYYSLIPLKEILSEIMSVGPNSKQVANLYNNLVLRAGSEIALLLYLPLSEIKRISNDILFEAIKRMRNREVLLKEGFDGEYGRITLFQKGEVKCFSSQKTLFKDFTTKKQFKRQPVGMVNFNLKEYRQLKKSQIKADLIKDKNAESPFSREDKKIFKELNSEQHKAVEHSSGPVLILAGPGTGKTKTLIHRIANLIKNKSVNPENVLAVTFTNKAANEVNERLRYFLKNRILLSKLTVTTFHSLGFNFLRGNYLKNGKVGFFTIIDEEDKKLILLKNVGCK